MRMEDLKTVMDVYHSQSFIDASYHCQIPISVLSKRIGRVEKELGVSLFKRAVRNEKMYITPEGETILPKIHNVLKQYEQICSVAGNVAEKREESLRIGYPRMFGTLGEFEIITEFQKAYPNIKLVSTMLGLKAMLSRFQEEELDAVFLMQLPDYPLEQLERLLNSESVSGLEYASYDRLVIVAGTGHPCAQKKAISLEDLRDAVIIMDVNQMDSRFSYRYGRRFLPDMMDQMKLPYQILFMDLSDKEAIYDAIKRGAGVIPMSGIPKRPVEGLVNLPLKDVHYRSRGILVWNNSRCPDALKKMISLAEQYAGNHGLSKQ